jgi:hypothetical protein
MGYLSDFSGPGFWNGGDLHHLPLPPVEDRLHHDRRQQRQAHHIADVGPVQLPACAKSGTEVKVLCPAAASNGTPATPLLIPPQIQEELLGDPSRGCLVWPPYCAWHRHSGNQPCCLIWRANLTITTARATAVRMPDLECSSMPGYRLPGRGAWCVSAPMGVGVVSS